MTLNLAALLAVLLGVIAALHVYWAVGGSWGSDVVVPTTPDGPDANSDGSPAFSPGALATAAVAALLVVAALVPLGAAGAVDLPVPEELVRFAIWALAVVLLVRAVGDFRYVGAFKRVRGTRFARLDDRFYTPLCLALSALAFGVALGSA